MLSLYKLSELIAAAKAIIRTTIGGVGTEPGTDHDLTIHAAANLLHGSQVAGQHIYEQLEPRTADAENRDRMVSFYGLSFEKEATKARGLIGITYGPDTIGSFTIDAGTEITLPGSAFTDGAERTFVTLEDIRHGSYQDGSTEVSFRTGSSIWKVRPQAVTGADFLSPRSLMRVKADSGVSKWVTAAKRVNSADHSVDLLTPVKGTIAFPIDTDDKVALMVNGVVVPVECTTAGAAGNVPWTLTAYETSGLDTYAIVFEMGGGGDAVSEVDGDTDRVVRLLEDTIACPPSFGNLQHWREIALACPDVDLDDAIVYQHVRGPGTIDIVCIGRSGGVRSTAYPDTNIGFTFWGNNQRRIGEVAAAKVEEWCQSKASYFADVKVRSVEWDWRGNHGAVAGTPAFFLGAGIIDLDIEPHDGYGPDSGVSLDIVPSVKDAALLYPASGTIDDAIEVGHRVWAQVGHATADAISPFATVVTEILSISSDRAYATIASVADLAPTPVGHSILETPYSLVVHRWGTAGPLTQSVLDAVYGYYDQLGPGSYILPPKGPGYMSKFGQNVYPPAPSHLSVSRWPSEGRRWSSGLRASELRAAILAIEGVKSVAVGADQDDLIDFDPKLWETLALTGCIPRYV